MCENLYKRRRLWWSEVFKCVFTQCQGGNTSATEATAAANYSGKGYKVIFKKSEYHHSSVRKIIHKWKMFKTVASRSRRGRPSEFTPKSVLRETAKNPRASSHTLQASLSMLNV